VFSISVERLRDHELAARADDRASAPHALVEPRARVLLATFEHSLAATRPGWTGVWP
jgi:hypothetical protein